ncbi:MAG TPA: hypothetical protein PKK12_08675 [Candidatus Aminicenantes bacterium]|nr:hypothetical protein [Candidatus Aminicenantes bacterium]
MSGAEYSPSERTPAGAREQIVHVIDYLDRLLGVRFSHYCAAPYDQNSVCHFQHFTQFVGDKNDRFSLLYQGTHDHK